MNNVQYLQMYRQTMGTGHPGCFIILIDQSGSMLDSFGQGQVGAGLRKCDQVATVVNRVLSELVARSTKNNIVNDRVHLAVLGYRNNAVYDAIPSLPGSSPSRGWLRIPSGSRTVQNVSMIAKPAK